MRVERSPVTGVLSLRCGYTEKTVKWEDVSSVRNIGVAYQIKCGEDHFTVKKQGFENGNDKDFKELIEKMNIKIN